jgi:hypothetical protein
MNLKKHTLLIAFAAASALPMSAPTVSAQNVQDRQSATSQGHERTIQGVWRTVVTPQDCQTGVPIVSFPGLFTFNEGGTMSEWGIRPGTSPALRSPGHGVWQREHGWQEYSFAFTYYRYNASGVLVGSQKITSRLELGASGDEFVTRSVAEAFDVNDTLISTSCVTTVGTRFEPLD